MGTRGAELSRPPTPHTRDKGLRTCRHRPFCPHVLGSAGAGAALGGAPSGPASTAIGDVVGTRGAELSPGHPRSDAARLKHPSPLSGPPVLRSETSWEHGVPNFPPATHAPMQRGSKYSLVVESVVITFLCLNFIYYAIVKHSNLKM